MGLFVTVNDVHSEEQMKSVYELLESRGLRDGWTEPEPLSLGPLDSRESVSGCAYSDYIAIKRAYVWGSRIDEVFYPMSLAKNSYVLSEMSDRTLLEIIRVMEEGKSHLVCHSNCQGFYVPIDFEEPLYDTEGFGVSGIGATWVDYDHMELPSVGVLGSSYGLRRELQQIAPMLGVELTGEGRLPDEEAELLGQMEYGQPMGIESSIFLFLWEMARLSIEHECAIHYC